MFHNYMHAYITESAIKFVNSDVTRCQLNGVDMSGLIYVHGDRRLSFSIYAGWDEGDNKRGWYLGWYPRELDSYCNDNGIRPDEFLDFILAQAQQILDSKKYEFNGAKLTLDNGAHVYRRELLKESKKPKPKYKNPGYKKQFDSSKVQFIVDYGSLFLAVLLIVFIIVWRVA
jgi:hypothetical protein